MFCIEEYTPGIKSLLTLALGIFIQALFARKKYDVLIILSGPEPQRTILEEKLIEQASKLSLKTLLIKGKTEEQNKTVGNFQTTLNLSK